MGEDKTTCLYQVPKDGIKKLSWLTDAFAALLGAEHGAAVPLAKLHLYVTFAGPDSDGPR